MTTSVIALIISGISCCIALFALGWNVYRDVIIKPKVKFSVQVSDIITPGDRLEINEQVIDFRATNYGPGIVHLNGLLAFTKKLFKKTRTCLVIHDYQNPLSNRFPCKLEVGESASFFLPFRAGSFLKENFTHLGIYDSFNRHHWAPKRDVKRSNKHYRDTFGNNKKSKTRGIEKETIAEVKKPQ